MIVESFTLHVLEALGDHGGGVKFTLCRVAVNVRDQFRPYRAMLSCGSGWRRKIPRVRGRSHVIVPSHVLPAAA